MVQTRGKSVACIWPRVKWAPSLHHRASAERGWDGASRRRSVRLTAPLLVRFLPAGGRTRYWSQLQAWETEQEGVACYERVSDSCSTQSLSLSMAPCLLFTWDVLLPQVL